MDDTTPQTYRLPDVPPESCAIIVGVDDLSHLERLKAMGVCLGRTIEVVKTGDPLILKVFGSRIGLSARLAQHVQVKLCPSSPRCWERQLPGVLP
jgi:Fe2+ transport system protein FeoA